jgi:Zn finger protein HypA/HybF involved in hydrogenase expression
MGSSVYAKCPCGFVDEFSIGGGMRDFQERCAFPSLCAKCGRMVEANLLGAPPRCPKCRSTSVTPYDDDSLVGVKGQYEVAGWNMEEELGRQLSLTDGTYRCPKCNALTLRFEHTGICFD